MAQTFEVNGQQSQPAPNFAEFVKRRSSLRPSPAANGDNGIGWGSSIEVGRLARAAEDALRRGNPSAAADYAQRAVKAAPQDNKLWFLLGYTSRLAGRYQTSVEAYQHGLQFAPGNADGMSGLAQTYERMGRTDDAKQLLAQVIRANPNRTNDLLILGELDMRTGDTQEGINLLQRAESQQPSAHAELMLAMAYLKLKQPDKAKQMLDLAKKHCARQCRDLPGRGELLSRGARLQSRDRHAEERSQDDARGAGGSWLHLRTGRRQGSKQPRLMFAPPTRSRKKLAISSAPRRPNSVWEIPKRRVSI